MMEKLKQLEISVSELSDIEYSQFSQWFLEHENERWDIQLEKDITGKKLDAFAKKAISDFNHGNYKPL